MKDTSQIRRKQLIVLLLVIVLAGSTIVYWGSPTSTHLTNKELNQTDSGETSPTNAVPLRASTQDDVIQRYVLAYQTGNCMEIAKLTLWVRERLLTIEEEGSDVDVAREKRDELCEQLFSRTIGDNTLSILGIDDQYLIPMTTTFTIDGADSGRRDLETAVMERVWVVFTYNDPGTAPKDKNGEAIHSLRAGLNISMDRLVLKGSVRGNWEVDFDSISLQW